MEERTNNWKVDQTWAKDQGGHFAGTPKRTQESGMESMKDKAYSDYYKQTFQIIKEINFSVPAKGETTTILTLKSFSAIGLIDYLIQQIGAYPKKMVCYIYSLNAKVATRLNEIADKTGETKLVISDLQNTAYRQKEEAVISCFKSTKIEQIYVHSHAKIISLFFNEDFQITILGSGNLAANARVEQYQIINDAGMWQFINDSYNDIKRFQISKRNKNGI